MEIWSPNDLGVGKPSIGSNHMHSIHHSKRDETSILVECNIVRALFETIER